MEVREWAAGVLEGAEVDTIFAAINAMKSEFFSKQDGIKTAVAEMRKKK